MADISKSIYDKSGLLTQYNILTLPDLHIYQCLIYTKTYISDIWVNAAFHYFIYPNLSRSIADIDMVPNMEINYYSPNRLKIHKSVLNNTVSLYNCLPSATFKKRTKTIILKICQYTIANFIRLVGCLNYF